MDEMLHYDLHYYALPMIKHFSFVQHVSLVNTSDFVDISWLPHQLEQHALQ
jgi:hypothetical protein